MTIHKSVLPIETIEALGLKDGMTVVDATLGGGGHSLEILQKIGATGKLVAIDQDQTAIDNFEKRLQIEGDSLSRDFGQQVVLAKDNFSNLIEILGGYGIDSVDAILADLGFSSDQMDDPERGMSFQAEAKLDMRLDRERRLTAETVVNKYDILDLEKIIRVYGEEKHSRSIARRIVERRKNRTIRTTTELVEIIASAVPARERNGRINPATKTFQALRIEVNKELESLEKFLPQAIEKLNSGGRLAVISFHSLEDRIVKNIFSENARGCVCPKDFPLCRCGHEAKIKIITRKPIVPEPGEVSDNPRARSAKLRVCEKI
jgi:16S rRNA (cytosine1402-N4)-methyltransferase